MFSKKPWRRQGNTIVFNIKSKSGIKYFIDVDKYMDKFSYTVYVQSKNGSEERKETYDSFNTAKENILQRLDKSNKWYAQEKEKRETYSTNRKQRQKEIQQRIQQIIEQQQEVEYE